MGRGSQIFWFLNMKKLPSPSHERNIFTHLTITEELREMRRDYQKNHDHIPISNSLAFFSASIKLWIYFD